MPSAPPARLYFPYLDALRGLLALSVVLSHYIKAYGLPCAGSVCQALHGEALHFFMEGDAAVCFFFVLSGFVLSVNAFRSEPGFVPRFWPGFYIARVFRIFPAYAMTLLIGGLLFAWHQSHPAGDTPTIPPQDDWIAGLWQYRVSFLHVLAELNLFWMPDLVVIVPQAWSLAVEIILSMAVPIGIRLASRHALLLLLLVIGLIIFPGLNRFSFHFALGILLARYLRPFIRILGRWPQLKSVLALTGGGLYLCGEYALNIVGVEFNGMVTAIGCVELLGVVLATAGLQRVLNSRGMVFLGKISYSVYLTHFMVIIAITPRFLAWWAASPANVQSAWVAGLLFTLSVTTLLSVPMYRWIEQPGIRLGKTLATRWNATRISHPH